MQTFSERIMKTTSNDLMMEGKQKMLCMWKQVEVKDCGASQMKRKHAKSLQEEKLLQVLKNPRAWV